MNIPLTNICNNKRSIYLFSRKNGILNIEEINDFFPYFYEPDTKGKFKAIDGTMLRKVYCSEPADVPKMRSLTSYSSDVLFTTNFIINRIDTIIPTEIKYLFIDIEILASELPTPGEAKYPVSCISVYNSLSKDIQTWYIADQEGSTLKQKENNLLEKFITYIKKEKPDIWFSWNVKFDYQYLFNRIPNFAKLISPIGFSRRGDEENIFFPCGISIVDYLSLFKKVYMREASYALDYITEKHLGAGKEFKNVDFSKLSDVIKKRNRGDVELMVKLEEKFKLVSYYDEIRRMTKCQWEDLYHNSRLVEYLLLEEAKNKQVVLPNKQARDENVEPVSFQGATRDVDEVGVFHNVGKLDLTSAYPSMIVNFCLDAQNINIEEGININGIKFKQNTEALLPTIVTKILKLKDELKKLRKSSPSQENDIKYDAIKAIVNSCFGVMGSPYFRLFNIDVASTITFLVRDLLMYVKSKVEAEGIKVLYWDTDSTFLSVKEDVSAKLNQYIQNWAKEKYNKDSIDLRFEYEGYFTSIIMLGKCHYYGYINGKTKPEIKGIEAKRSSSSKFEATFQEALLNNIIKGETKEDIITWISQEQERIKEFAIEDIGFPCKLTSKEYKNYPIFMRAYDNTLKIKKDFKVNIGELFWYVFTKDSNQVLAFTKDDKDFIKRENIDWSRIIDRNIDSKAQKIFDALKWHLPTNTNQLQLF